MYAKILFTILLFIVAKCSYGQPFSYSYKDPCTGVIKTITVPSNGITVTYYGTIKTFAPEDFYNGNFEQWTTQVFSTFGSNNPCASVVGVPTSINIAQSTAINFIGIVNSLSAIGDLSQSNFLSGAIGSAENSSSSGSSGSGSSGSGSGEKSGSGGSSGSSSSGGSNNKESKDEKSLATSDGNSQTSGNEKGKTNLVGGAVSSVANSSGNSSASSKNGNRPSIIASSDFVGFNFKNSDISYGAKVTGGYTSMRWDGLRSHGATFDYTSALKGPNVTGFYAFLGKRKIDLISATVTAGFDAKKSIYGTIAFGEMWNIGKKKKLKAVYMLTASYGKVYEESFVGTAVIGGGMYDFKITKRVDVKLMGLYVYAPYVGYYNDILLKSPHVVLPIVGMNLGITKRFKINLNGGGAWALNENTLNYTIMMGTRLLL